MSEKIQFLKVRKVKEPSRAYKYDAGIDFYVPEFDYHFIKDLKKANTLVFGDPTNKYTGPEYYNTVGVGYVNGNTGTLTISGNDKSVASICYDLTDENKSIIKFDDERGENYFLLSPHSRIMIPSGIKSRMAKPGRALIATNKSGIATKHGLIVGATTVDYTYKGEIHLSVINTSTKPVRIYENMKIIQFIETPVFNSTIEVTESLYRHIKDEEPYCEKQEDFYKGLDDDRKDGGFGSSGS